MTPLPSPVLGGQAAGPSRPGCGHSHLSTGAPHCFPAGALWTSRSRGWTGKGQNSKGPSLTLLETLFCHTLLPGLGGWPLSTAQCSSKGHPLHACVFSPSRDQCWPPPGPRAHRLAAQAMCQDSKALGGHLLERPQTEAGGSPDPVPCSLTLGVCTRTWREVGVPRALTHVAQLASSLWASVPTGVSQRPRRPGLARAHLAWGKDSLNFQSVKPLELHGPSRGEAPRQVCT